MRPEEKTMNKIAGFIPVNFIVKELGAEIVGYDGKLVLG